MEEVGRDPEQPGSGVGSRKVIPSATVEGDQEGLGGKLVGEVSADPPLQIGVNGIEVAIEDRRELAGIVAEAEMASLSRARWSTESYCPLEGDRFAPRLRPLRLSFARALRP